MGKNKGKKNVFKVAGAKSLKLKKKAKAVNTQLKKLNVLTREKTEESNKQLAQIEDAVRQTTTLIKRSSASNIKKDSDEMEKQEIQLKEMVEDNVEKIKSINV